MSNHLDMTREPASLEASDAPARPVHSISVVEGDEPLIGMHELATWLGVLGALHPEVVCPRSRREGARRSQHAGPTVPAHQRADPVPSPRRPGLARDQGGGRVSTRWGVYNLQGKDPKGGHVEADSARAVRWFVRWRVNGAEHKRTFKKKGYAKTFHKSLGAAETCGWAADDRGWPINPSAVSASPPTLAPAPVEALTFEAYCRDVWWPIHDPGFGDKNRIGHRRNMEVAIDLLRYGPGDVRVDRHTRSGQSIRLDQLRADDCKQALVRRSRINGRTAAVNARRSPKPIPVPP